MLILTVKPNESVHCLVGDNDIEVFVLGVERNRVKLGFKAPMHTTILRDKLYQQNAQLLEVML